MPESYPVKDLMVDLDGFHSVSVDATFIEAHAALEKAREEFQAGRTRYRILLVADESGNIIGKLSPMDLVQGLEPRYRNIIDPNRLRFKDTLYGKITAECQLPS